MTLITTNLCDLAVTLRRDEENCNFFGQGRLDLLVTKQVEITRTRPFTTVVPLECPSHPPSTN